MDNLAFFLLPYFGERQKRDITGLSQIFATITESTIAGYGWSQHQSQYGGIEQRWLVVESKERQESDLKRLEKNQDKAKTEATKQLLQLSRQSFACVADALNAASKLSKKLKYYCLAKRRVAQLIHR